MDGGDEGGRRFLTARWVHLVMINYEVEPAVLGALVPEGTELDRWRGKCFVSMVGFQFLDTRVLGVAIPFHRDFEEDVDGRRNRLAARPEGEASISPPDAEESFIAEHYWGYSAQRDGSTVEYRVEHPPWEVWRGRDPELQCDVERLYAPQFREALAAPPSSCFIARGSAVSVLRGRRL